MRLFIVINLIFILTASVAQNPLNQWMKFEMPEDAGFSSEELQKLDEIYSENGASALIIIYKGNILYTKGDIYRRFDCHSIRKSIVSGLYGIYTDKNLIDITKSLKDIGIDDSIKLTEQEKSSKIEYLLKSKSGVYIPALGEGGNMAEIRPERNSHKPDEFFYYNNWDFNALNTIFEKLTEQDIVNTINHSIAVPLGMEDYRIFDSKLWLDNSVNTIHAKLDIKISARDLARFGVLYCNYGKWNDIQLISKDWIIKSFKPYTNIQRNGYVDSYGYMWWIEHLDDSIPMYSGRGYGEQLLTIVPSHDLVMVKFHDTYQSKLGDGWTGHYIKAILRAKTLIPKEHPVLLPLETAPSLYVDTINLSNEELMKYEQDIFYGGRVRKLSVDNNRVLFDDNFLMYPVSKDKFYIEDYNMYMHFRFDNNKPKFDRIE